MCVTLVFTTAIFGNLAKYVEANGDLKNREYEGDFRLGKLLIRCMNFKGGEGGDDFYGS